MSIAILLMLLAQQPAPNSTLEGLPTQIEAGRSIQVVDADGVKINGRFLGATTNSLRITVDGTPREIPGDTIRQIRLRLPDPKWNGVLIGAGIGALAALIGASGKDDAEQTYYERAAFVPLFTGIGMGGGALIDFAIKRYRTVFEVTPVISNERKGMKFQVRF